MPPKKKQPDTHKPAKDVKKSESKSTKKKSQSKSKKKRKNRKIGPWTITFPILPKRKRLTKKVVTKLNNETDRYMLARGLDSIKRLHHYDPRDILDNEERKWRMSKKASAEHKKLLDEKTKRIFNRARRRRKRAEERRKEELRRKRYRVHPDDPLHKYRPGYKRTRHRISKSRFIRCVDIPLFLQVLNENKELVDSPLWDEKLSFKNMSAEKCEQLKDHLYQFDVLVECLKQGIFDRPGCDAFDVYKVRRKRKPKTIKSKGSRKAKEKEAIERRKTITDINSDERINAVKRLLSFPPYERADEDLGGNDAAPRGNWFNRVTKWIGDINIKASQAKTDDQSMRDSIAPSVLPEDNSTSFEDLHGSKAKPKTSEKWKMHKAVSVVEHSFKWAKSQRTSLKAFPPMLRKSAALSNDGDGDMGNDDNDLGPFADFITLRVPTETGNQRKFIRTLVERKQRKVTNDTSKPTGVDVLKQEEEAARHRHERMERLDPFQRLIEDDKDSDIWSKTNTTTTDGYASWRRPRGHKDANKQDILAHKVDTTLGWRVMLLIIILWEIGRFVKGQLDELYYWVFASHLFRENIWLFEPSLFAPIEQHYVIHFQKWSHVIISTISLSIIHRENECVSLLFAFSLLLDGTLAAGMSIHDYVYLPDPVDRLCIAVTALHVICKVFIICLFISYHYYCAGYIRKAREFQHRKTMLHNHEIKAKGTKGLQKRKMAWSWMTRHARNTNLRYLKKKYSDIKDGNFPEEEIANKIRFSEAKELRLYTQKHNLTIGYPYNKLRDMKRYVFSKLEKSDYSDKDEMEKEEMLRKKMRQLERRGSRAMTQMKWEKWKKNQDDESRKAKRWQKSQSKSQPEAKQRPQAVGAPRLTIDNSFSRRQLSSLTNI